jgi:hypothetical protein
MLARSEPAGSRRVAVDQAPNQAIVRVNIAARGASRSLCLREPRAKPVRVEYTRRRIPGAVEADKKHLDAVRSIFEHYTFDILERSSDTCSTLTALRLRAQAPNQTAAIKATSGLPFSVPLRGSAVTRSAVGCGRRRRDLLGQQCVRGRRDSALRERRGIRAAPLPLHRAPMRCSRRPTHRISVNPGICARPSV